MRVHFSDLADVLEQALQTELPGTRAQLSMAPAYRMEPSQAQVTDKDCRQAGVLLAIYPSEQDEEATFLLTKRRDHLPDHPGQISLPGGQQNYGESLQTSALREAQEEIGLAPERVTIIGALTPLYIPPSSFCVYPYVGLLEHKPILTPHSNEVDTIYHVPISRLTEDRALRSEERTLHGNKVTVPYFELNKEKVWGATAMILAEFRELYRTLLKQFS